MMFLCCPLVEVLYRLLDRGLSDDELDLVVGIPLLDQLIQQTLVFPNFDLVGQWCERWKIPEVLSSPELSLLNCSLEKKRMRR